MHTKDIKALLEALPEDHYWHTVLTALVNYDDAGIISLKSWMKSNDGANCVTTLQAAVKDGKVTQLWAPGPRKVDASRSTYVRLDNSRRDYAGMKCIKATSTTWLGYDADMSTYVLYQA